MNVYSVYHEFHQDFVRFAISLCHQRQLAEDLVQESYLKAIDQEQLFEVLNSHQTKAWFFMTIKRNYIDYHRRKQLEINHFMQSKMDEMCTSPHYNDNILLKNALNSLCQDDLKLFLLRYNHGYNASELSEMLGQNPSTIRGRLSNITKKLRAKLKKEG